MSIRVNKQKYMGDLAMTPKNAETEENMEQLYGTMKKRAGKYSNPERPVRDKEGRTITKIQEKRNRWTEHFVELLNRPAPLKSPDIETAPEDIPIDVTPLIIRKIRMAIKQVKSGKKSGPDDLTLEELRSDIEATVNMNRILFREIWEEEQMMMA